jgi:hypothetical protein
MQYLCADAKTSRNHAGHENYLVKIWTYTNFHVIVPYWDVDVTSERSGLLTLSLVWRLIKTISICKTVCWNLEFLISYALHPIGRYAGSRMFFFLPVALQSLKDLGHLTYRRLLELFRQTVGLLGRVWSTRRKAPTYTGQHNTERRGQTSMPWVGFEPTIPATNRPRPTPQTARPLWQTPI